MTRDQKSALLAARNYLIDALHRDPTRPSRPYPHEDLSEADLPLDALALAVAAYLEARALHRWKWVAEEVKALRDELGVLPSAATGPP